MRYEITIEGTPKTWNAFINRTHWAYYKYAQAIKKQIHVELLQRRVPKLSRVRITFTLGFTNRHRSDICDRCTKPHVDALVDNGVLEDDHREIVAKVSTEWEKSDKAFTKIIIEDLCTAKLHS